MNIACGPRKKPEPPKPTLQEKIDEVGREVARIANETPPTKEQAEEINRRST